MGGLDLCAPCDSTPGSCVPESEPNEDPAQTIAPMTGGFCVEGNVGCGNDGSAYSADSDRFVMVAPTSTTVDVTLTWQTSADVDLFVFDDPAATPLVNYTDGMATMESGAFSAVNGTTYYFQVSCWTGQSQPYLLEVVW
jgi:hypothetical protein